MSEEILDAGNIMLRTKDMQNKMLGRNSGTHLK
jgi:hypothetical protein